MPTRSVRAEYEDEKKQENVYNAEQEGDMQEEGKDKQGGDKELQEGIATRAEKMIDGRVGRREED